MRDEKREKEKFAEAMVRLRNCYGAFFGDDGEWRARMAAYFDQLRRHELADVEAGLSRAPTAEHYPDRFPTAGQLQRVVVAIELERKQRTADGVQREMRRSEEDCIREEFAAIPIGEEAQRAYIAEAKGPWEHIARVWQCESKRLGLDPMRPSPAEIQQRRMSEFWSMWSSSEPQTLPTPSYRRGGSGMTRAQATARAYELAREIPFGPKADNQPAGDAGTNPGE